MDINLYLSMVVGGFFVGIGNVTGQWFFNTYMKDKIENNKLVKLDKKSILGEFKSYAKEVFK